MKRVLACLALAAALWPLCADAGRRPFFWVYDTEVVPDRGVELEQWVWERRYPKALKLDMSSVWWAPVVGVSDHLEVALPIEWFWVQGQGSNIDTAGVDLRYRFLDPDPEKAGPVVPLVRAGVKRLFRSQVTQGELNLVLSVDAATWLHFAFDVGGVIRSDGELWGTFATGASAKLSESWRGGVEALSEVFEQPDKSFVMLGPDVSYSLGRFWFTGGVLIGLNRTAPKVMPRMIWAVGF